MSWISFSNLRTLIGPRAPSASGGFTGDIQEESTNYQILVTDGVVSMTGIVTATFPNIAGATEGVWVECFSGTLTLAGDAPIQGPNPLTTGQAGYFVPLPSGSWRQF